MDSIGRNDEYLNTYQSELIIIENNSVFVKTAGINQLEQINVIRNKHGIIVANNNVTQ